MNPKYVHYEENQLSQRKPEQPFSHFLTVAGVLEGEGVLEGYF